VAKYRGIRDRLDTTTETFSVSECSSCGVGFLNPMPIGDASIYYPKNYLSGEKKTQTSKGFDFEKWYRYNQYRYDFKLLKRATGLDLWCAESYIDIGCGSGERVLFAKNQGIKRAVGVDKFDFAKWASRQEVKILNSDVLKYKPAKKYQVVSLFHVLEHVETPKVMLRHIQKSILADDGYLVVQVPNYRSLEKYIFKSRWFSFDVPRHLWQFNSAVIINLLNKSGYKINAVFELNAPLHPVTIVPSVHRDLDIQRIWSSRHGEFYKQFMTLLWAGLTILIIPANIVQNIFKRASMLTIIASKKIS